MLSSIRELVIPDQNVPCRDGSVILLLQLMYGASMPGYVPTTVDLGLMSVSLRSELDQQGPGFISGDPLCVDFLRTGCLLHPVESCA